MHAKKLNVVPRFAVVEGVVVSISEFVAFCWLVFAATLAGP
jgi:hypothetical protein